MCAFVYALNDSDERVRLEAAQQIVHQLKRHACCCSDKVAQALMCALGDCDKKVRKMAEKGLCLCGYEVTSACNSLCSASTCGANGCGPAAAGCGPAAAGCGPAASTSCGPAPAAAAPAPAAEAAPAPAPPAAEPEAYFPARIRDQQTGASRARNTLGNLFGLR
jgi:hypothetical protein